MGGMFSCDKVMWNLEANYFQESLFLMSPVIPSLRNIVRTHSTVTTWKDEWHGFKTNRFGNGDDHSLFDSKVVHRKPPKCSLIGQTDREADAYLNHLFGLKWICQNLRSHQRLRTPFVSDNTVEQAIIQCIGTFSFLLHFYPPAAPKWFRSTCARQLTPESGSIWQLVSNRIYSWSKVAHLRGNRLIWSRWRSILHWKGNFYQSLIRKRLHFVSEEWKIVLLPTKNDLSLRSLVSHSMIGVVIDLFCSNYSFLNHRDESVIFGYDAPTLDYI